jgi:hypothetical protein
LAESKFGNDTFSIDGDRVVKTLEYILRPIAESKEATCEPGQGFKINSTVSFHI